MQKEKNNNQNKTMLEKIKKAIKDPIDFDGERTVEGIMKFLKEHVATKLVIDEEEKKDEKKDEKKEEKKEDAKTQDL